MSGIGKYDYYYYYCTFLDGQHLTFVLFQQAGWKISFAAFVPVPLFACGTDSLEASIKQKIPGR